MIREITDAMCVIDHENHVLWTNGTFHDWFSHHGSVLGKKLDDVLPGAAKSCGTSAVFSDIDATHRKRYFKVECVPTFDENGLKVSDLLAFRDVTILQTLLDYIRPDRFHLFGERADGKSPRYHRRDTWL